VNTVTNRAYLSGSKTVILDDATQTVIKEVAGRGYAYTATNSSTNRYYGLNGNTLTIMTGDNLDILDTIQVGDNPFSVATDPAINHTFVIDNSALYILQDSGTSPITPTPITPTPITPTPITPTPITPTPEAPCPLGVTLDFSKWFKNNSGLSPKDIFTIRKGITGVNETLLTNFGVLIKIEGMGELGFDGTFICPDAKLSWNLAERQVEFSLSDGKKVSIHPTNLTDFFLKWELSGSIEPEFGPENVGINTRSFDKPITPPEFYTIDVFDQVDSRFVSTKFVKLSIQLRTGMTATLRTLGNRELTALLYLVAGIALAYAATAIAAILVAHGAFVSVAAALVVVAVMVKDLYNRYQSAPGILAGKASQTTITSHQTQYAAITDEVMQEVHHYFTDDFLVHTTLSPLVINKQIADRGEAIAFSGSGFTPGGKVLISLANGSARTNVEVIASSSGAINGTIQVSQSAAGGKALLTALDIANLPAQIEAFIQNPQGNITDKTYMGVEVVQVPSRVHLPFVHR
jgi:hypothetical protein